MSHENIHQVEECWANGLFYCTVDVEIRSHVAQADLKVIGLLTFLCLAPGCWDSSCAQHPYPLTVPGDRVQGFMLAPSATELNPEPLNPSAE